MSRETVPELLAHYLETYCNVNAPLISDLKMHFQQTRNQERVNLFRNQLANAIKKNALTCEQYEDLTGEDFDSQEDITIWLRQLWLQLFDEEFNH